MSPSSTSYTIQDPRKLLRHARVVAATHEQLQAVEPGPETVAQLAAGYRQTLDAVHEHLGDNLGAELRALSVPLEDAPSEGELRVAHAQLAGWLRGLMQTFEQAGALPPAGGSGLRPSDGHGYR